MHILMLSAYYSPDGGPAAPLFRMLAEALVQRGHIVTVITTVPHYPSGQVPASYGGWSARISTEGGVKVIRLPLPSLNRSNLPARLLQFGVYQILATLHSLRLSFDVFISHTSALEVWLPFMVNAAIRRKPSIYSVHDVYPDVGIKLGIFRGRLVVGLVTGLEKGCLSCATTVRILSESFRERIESLGVPGSKIELIYDWVDCSDAALPPRHNAFSCEHGLNNTFNVVYAGNMGMVQGLESVLECAAQLREEQRIRFVLVGDGTARRGLVEKAEQMKLTNVLFVPYQPREKMPEIWASADAGLIVLRKGTGFGALPSKALSIMANRRAILASVDVGSETWKLVQAADAGVCVPPEDASQMAEAIFNLEQDQNLRESQGRHGRAWVEHHHSPRFAAERFEGVLLGAAERADHHPEFLPGRPR